MDSISIITITYNTGERLLKYVKDVIKSVNVKIDNLIVIDNTPNDDNYRLIIEGLYELGAKKTDRKLNVDGEYIVKEYEELELASVNICVVNSKDNLVYAKGNNLGVQILSNNYKSKYVLISNEDILFENSYVDIRLLVETMKSDERIGVIGPAVVGLDGCKQSPCDYMSIGERIIMPYLIYPFERFLKKAKNEIMDVEKPSEVYRLIGAFMLVDIDKFRECGLFDRNIFLYAEELILSEQMRKRGYIIYYQPNVKVIHEVGVSTVFNLETVIRRIKRMNKSNMYYYEKYINTNAFLIMVARISYVLFLIKFRIIHTFLKK